MNNQKLLSLIPILILLIFILPGYAYSQKKGNQVELLIPDSETTDPGWELKPDSFHNLEILDSVDEKKSKEKFEKAAEDYKYSIESFQSVQKDIENKREDFLLQVNPEDRYDWQKKARKDAQERELKRLLMEGRNHSIQFLIRGMNKLDEIENPKVKESDSFLDLKAGFYREYAKHQFAMKNYVPVTDMLSRYILLDDRFYKESEPHKLLAVCYEKLEESAAKNRRKKLSMEFKEKKKRHLVTYAEIHYGKDSREFQRIMDKVMRDY